MTETAIVLFVKHTGHVVATVTRTGDPAAAPKPEELAGDHFPVRDDGGDVLVEVDPGELDSKVVPFEEDLLLNPQKCGVTNGDAQLLAGAAPTLQLQQSGVTVTLPANATEKTKVWAQVDSGTGQTRQHEVVKGEIAVGTDNVELAKTFASGQEYDVLALTQGCEPATIVDRVL